MPFPDLLGTFVVSGILVEDDGERMLKFALPIPPDAVGDVARAVFDPTKFLLVNVMVIEKEDSD